MKIFVSAKNNSKYKIKEKILTFIIVNVRDKKFHMILPDCRVYVKRDVMMMLIVVKEKQT